jgi:hypothetical protein
MAPELPRPVDSLENPACLAFPGGFRKFIERGSYIEYLYFKGI